MSETIQRTKLYEDVTERMLDHIRTETWAPGTKIPPEVELAKLFDVSRCTIREAVKSLQIAGFLRSRAGSGTFVSERAPTLLQTQALGGQRAVAVGDGFGDGCMLVDAAAVDLQRQRLEHAHAAHLARGGDIESIQDAVVRQLGQ